MQENISTRQLQTELTQEEKVARGEEMGKLLAELEGLDSQLKAATSGIKAKINDAKKKQKLLGHVLATGKEEREIEVRTDKDWDRKEVVLVRLDTGAVVERRTMTASEAQADFLDRGAEPGKLLPLDGGKAFGEDGGEPQQPELSEDEKVWADAIDGTGRSFPGDEPAEGTDEADDADADDQGEGEESGEGEEVPELAPEPSRKPKKSPKAKKESA